jgi:hypothetical protein
VPCAGMNHILARCLSFTGLSLEAVQRSYIVETAIKSACSGPWGAWSARRRGRSRTEDKRRRPRAGRERFVNGHVGLGETVTDQFMVS